MLTFTIKRILLALLVALTVSMISFGILYLSGDPAVVVAGPEATDQEIEFIRKAYGFDRPVIIQYINWVGNALRGDFGSSYYYRMSVSKLIGDRLPTTMFLGTCGFIFGMILAIPLGVLAAIRPNSWIDRLALTLSIIGQALPTFWFALMLVVLLCVWYPLFPPSGSESWENFVIPSIVIGYYVMPAIMRLTRAGMIDVLESDYIRTARAKGLLPGKVLFKHALRNAMIPVVSISAVQFGYMLGGSVVIETVFAVKGVGYLIWEAITRSDFPTVQAIILLIFLIYVVITTIADLFNAWIDPRIRIT
jgi:peptide/nickel transport system permease protein